MSKSAKIILLVFLVLFLDQALKIWVKTHMAYGDEIPLFGFDRALIHFVENNGMAFGMSFGGDIGKLALSIFRIIAVIFLGYYIKVLIKAQASIGLLCSFALILAGALGNIIDSAFYGLIFSESYHGKVATMFPESGGYAGFLFGKVVDMLHFPIITSKFPTWFPIWGGESFTFFRPVFNIADVAITTGVISIIVFHRSFFSTYDNLSTEATTPEAAIASATTTTASASETALPTSEEEGMANQPDHKDAKTEVEQPPIEPKE